MMEYKGYAGKVEFDDEAGIFHGIKKLFAFAVIRLYPFYHC